MPDQQVDATRQARNSNKRALVLAGGGAAGNAWELGLIAGLSDAGVDVTEADLIIGTSAGSTVAAQITSGTRPAELYAAILAEVRQPQAGDAGSERGRAPNFSGPTYIEWSNGIIGSAEDASDMRRKMGAAALEMDASDGSSQTRWRDIVAARLPSQHWPQQPVLIAAVDAHTGEPVVFDRHSGIDLVDAVAASTSNGFGPFPPYRIGENRYINGGHRSSGDAPLAARQRRERGDWGGCCSFADLGRLAGGKGVGLGRAVWACGTVEPDRSAGWCGRGGGEAGPGDGVPRGLAHEPLGWRPTTLLITIRRYRCTGCGHVWRQDTSRAPSRGRSCRVVRCDGR